MILVFDDNKFRLKNICKELRFSNLPVKGESYENCEYITKPMVTVLIAPEAGKIEHYINQTRSQNTLCILVLKNDIPEKKYAVHTIINPDGMITPEQVKDIIKKKYDYDFVADTVNRIKMAEDKRDVYYCYKRLYLTAREYEIVRFFAYNTGKVFTFDEISEYLHLKNRVKSNTFDTYISKINCKCHYAIRGNIIIRSSYGYGVVVNHHDMIYCEKNTNIPVKLNFR